MDFMMWLTRWLARHPLKPSASQDPTRYTTQVMQSVRAVMPPAVTPAPWRRWLVWPALGLGAAVATALLLIIMTRPSGSVRLAQRVTQEAHVLNAVDDGLVDSVELAQSEETTDEQWLEQTQQLLDEAGDELETTTPADTAGTDEEWLEELRLLDDGELATSS